MLVENERISEDDFLKVFEKKFFNFCQKSPVLLRYTMLPEGVEVTTFPDEEMREFKFNFKEPVKLNIRHIRDWLVENKYPVLLQIEERKENYSPEELNTLVSNGKIKLTEISAQKKKVRTVTPWRIDRVIVSDNRIFLFNLNEKIMYHFKLRMSVVAFLKYLREKTYSDIELSDMFFSHAVLITKGV